MLCPKCQGKTKVVDSRWRPKGNSKTRKPFLYRRRECVKCSFRFSTMEVAVTDFPKRSVYRLKIKHSNSS